MARSSPGPSWSPAPPPRIAADPLHDVAGEPRAPGLEETRPQAQRPSTGDHEVHQLGDHRHREPLDELGAVTAAHLETADPDQIRT
ncbi:MAG TPA: hypothetical protein VHN14_28955 [Kofleriaceae bacterium]|nr:hypothetical protein [Kofleriaceae bacterium]